MAVFPEYFVHIRCEHRGHAERLQCNKGFIARYKDVLCRHLGTVRAAQRNAAERDDAVLPPQPPLAVSKLAGIWTVRTYRETYKLYMANGILFNHESEVGGPEFVTRKISMAVARIANGYKEPVILGNLSAVKDWGYARDYVDGMWKMLQQDYPDDFVLGTNESHTVREFVEAAFRTIGKSITWKGSGVNEVGLSEDGKTLVKVSREFSGRWNRTTTVEIIRKPRRRSGGSPRQSLANL